jgi:hypothetical protein
MSLGLRDKEDSWRNLSSNYSSQLPADSCPSDLPYEHTMERWAAHKAMEFIEPVRSRPYCIQIALQRPHHPLISQQQFWDMYPQDIELPATIDREPVGRPPHFQEMWKTFSGWSGSLRNRVTRFTTGRDMPGGERSHALPRWMTWSGAF